MVIRSGKQATPSFSLFLINMQIFVNDDNFEYFFFFFFFRLLPFRVHRKFGSVLRRMPFLTQLTTAVGNLARPFNVLGCTLEGNQLRHCAAKPIVSSYHSKHKWVFTPRVLRSRDQPIMSRTHYPLSHWGSILFSSTKCLWNKASNSPHINMYTHIYRRLFPG